MGVPAGLDSRYKGNVMYVPSGDKTQVFPVHNYASTVPFVYAAPNTGNYQLATTYCTDTSDGKLAGIDLFKSLPHVGTAAVPLAAVSH